MFKKIVFTTFDWVLLVLVFCAILFNIYFKVAQVRGTSMNHTYKEGDFVYAQGLFLGNIKRGDVVIFNNLSGIEVDSPYNIPGITHFKVPEQYIKRVVGVPGDVVQLDGNQVVVNGKEINSKDVGVVNIPTKVEFTLADDEFFVLGDNRVDALDSRHFGVLPKSYITSLVINPLELNAKTIK